MHFQHSSMLKLSLLTDLCILIVFVEERSIGLCKGKFDWLLEEKWLLLDCNCCYIFLCSDSARVLCKFDNWCGRWDLAEVWSSICDEDFISLHPLLWTLFVRLCLLRMKRKRLTFMKWCQSLLVDWFIYFQHTLQSFLLLTLLHSNLCSIKFLCAVGPHPRTPLKLPSNMRFFFMQLALVARSILGRWWSILFYSLLRVAAKLQLSCFLP